MGSRKLIVHIGFHKTGSSAIQAALALNQPYLEDRRILYPTSPSFVSAKKEGVTSGNGHYVDWILEDDVSISDIRIHQLKELFLEHPDQDIIFSSELLFRFKKEQMRLLAKICFEAGRELCVIGYMRHVADYFMSFYHQRIKRHGYSKSFLSFLKEISSSEMLTQFDALRNLYDLRDCLSLSLCNYDEVKSRLFCDFFYRIGLSDVGPLVLPKNRVNRSLTFLEISTLRFVNVILKKDGVSRSICDFLVKKFPNRKSFKKISEEAFLFIKKEYGSVASGLNAQFGFSLPMQLKSDEIKVVKHRCFFVNNLVSSESKKHGE